MVAINSINMPIQAIKRWAINVSKWIGILGPIAFIFYWTVTTISDFKIIVNAQENLPERINALEERLQAAERDLISTKAAITIVDEKATYSNNSSVRMETRLYDLYEKFFPDFKRPYIPPPPKEKVEDILNGEIEIEISPIP